MTDINRPKRIGIYKPGYRVLFNSDETGDILINPEVKNLALILARDNLVSVVSDCDLPPSGNPRKGTLGEKYDVKIICNGRLYKKGDIQDVYAEDDLNKIKFFLSDTSSRKFEFVTDLKIVTKNLLDGVSLQLPRVTQSPKFGVYGELEKIFLLNSSFNDTPISDKEPAVVYVGNSRGGARDALIENYLVNSGVQYALFGNFDKFNCRGKVPYSQSQSTMSKFKYTLVISDKEYQEANFLTPRYYEGILAGNIVFVDVNYDREGFLVSPHDWRVVTHGKELKEKIDFLEQNPQIAEKVLRRQRCEIPKSYFDGTYMQKKLNDVICG